jgi:hypothetical protein
MVFLAALWIVRGLSFWRCARLFGHLCNRAGTDRPRLYVLFGKVAGRAERTRSALSCCSKLGPAAFIVNFFGNCYVLDLRLDQEYLRSQPVNSEEGAPMGIGIWYEMWISDPVAYLFKNTDPRGSLRANVSNATVRCLSNMPLADMLQTRHQMSQTVRTEVSPQSQAWGYQLGSVYIRKVHFRDAEMIRQIEEKVVNRLRQVTAAIQTGRREPGERHRELGGKREASPWSSQKRRPSGPATLGQALAGDRPRAGGVGSAFRCAGDAADSGRQRALHFAAGGAALPHPGESAGGGSFRAEPARRRGLTVE